MKKVEEKGKASEVISVRLPKQFLNAHIGKHKIGNKLVWNSKKLRKLIQKYYKQTEPFDEPKKTTHNFKNDEIKSALQKACRRADQHSAGFWAWEMATSGEKWIDILFNRLLIISFEDVDSPIAPLLVDLTHRKAKSFFHSSIPRKNDDARMRKRKKQSRGEAILIAMSCAMHLARMKHRREADSQMNYLNYLNKNGKLNKKTKPSIPKYALDKHTIRGAKLHEKDKEYNFWTESIKLKNTADDYDRKYEKLMQEVAKEMDKEKIKKKVKKYVINRAKT